MSIGSGAVRIPRRFVPGAMAAVVAALLVAVMAAVVTVALWTATTGSNARVGPDAFAVSPQRHPKGGLAGRIAQTDRSEIVVRGETCELCWKYR